VGRRVAALLSGHSGVNADNGAGLAGRPRGNPAFTEALFFELVRAGQFDRAFAQLSPDCRRAWISPQHFAEQQRSENSAALQTVAVKDVRYLPEWRDERSGITHRPAAELQVEYTVGSGQRRQALRRTVHLVPERDKWRSICYPPEVPARSAR
jgi:hypothetical protein